MRGMIGQAVGWMIVVLARLITAVRGIWMGIEPSSRQRIYFANHVSHGDFVLIWTTLPTHLRRRTRPVAAADYWNASGMRRFIGRDVFDAVLIERPKVPPDAKGPDAIGIMSQALESGDSLILFPEGTRNTTPEPLMPFKSGLFRLAQAHPEVELVPVWIENLNRVLPKGEFVPVPIICTVTFGAPLHLKHGEEKDAFLARARAAMLNLRVTEEPA
ncbi:lysophospholipid acyltransferase family protein [Oceaniglobus trochenteri]|uniref:lysophospholipid acyltransferase family protein n=1 Tax=Oceaniglobus trochenteri TaxID=2763260 RepID=UPI001CFFBCB9|nr:lysophospholipid acyltransferase family protein [Oceaniglobus trochenteri]